MGVESGLTGHGVGAALRIGFAINNDTAGRRVGLEVGGRVGLAVNTDSVVEVAVREEVGVAVGVTVDVTEFN